MTKKRSSSSLRTRFLLGSKIVVLFSVFVCVYTLFRLHSQSSTAVRDAAAAVVHRPEVPFAGNPKIAFLFLARRNLPLDFLWQSFFQNGDAGNFSIYIHSEPGFVFDESTTRCSFFYARQLSKSVKVAWGEASMIEAEDLLLAEALRDPANQRFILLSDSCVPLYNFTYIYNYLMASTRSYVDSFLDPKGNRYNPKMSPVIPRGRWRKGSQWVTLVRKHAEVIVADRIILPVFKRHCKRRPALNLEQLRAPKPVVQKEHNCIPDEHYVQTLLAMSELEDEVDRRTLTYSLWNHTMSGMESKGWHPVTFEYANAGPKQIKEIKGIIRVDYETENRTEWCRSNYTHVPCFLFARKFSRGAAMRLLTEGVTGPFTYALLPN